MNFDDAGERMRPFTSASHNLGRPGQCNGIDGGVLVATNKTFSSLKNKQKNPQYLFKGTEHLKCV